MDRLDLPISCHHYNRAHIGSPHDSNETKRLGSPGPEFQKLGHLGLIFSFFFFKLLIIRSEMNHSTATCHQKAKNFRHKKKKSSHSL